MGEMRGEKARGGAMLSQHVRPRVQTVQYKVNRSNYLLEKKEVTVVCLSVADCGGLLSNQRARFFVTIFAKSAVIAIFQQQSPNPS